MRLRVFQIYENGCGVGRSLGPWGQTQYQDTKKTQRVLKEQCGLLNQDVIMKRLGQLGPLGP